MPYPRIIARVQTKNLRAELWANGVPCVMLYPGEGDRPVAVPLNELLVSGRNEIGVMLHAAPLASRSGDPWDGDRGAAAYHGPASLTVRLAEYSPDQTVAAGNPPAITTLDWQGEAVPRPSMVTREFSLSAPLGPWAWQTAERFAALNERVRGRAMDYLKSLHGMLAGHRYEEFAGEHSYKLAEMTERAYGVPSAPMRRDMLTMLERHGLSPWRLDPLDPAQVDLRLAGDGRLIECLRKDRHCALEYTRADSKDTFFLPAMIGVVGGVWRVLR